MSGLIIWLELYCNLFSYTSAIQFLPQHPTALTLLTLSDYRMALILTLNDLQMATDLSSDLQMDTDFFNDLELTLTS